MILDFIKKDLQRHARDPVALILWAAIPLVVAILMRAAFGGSGGHVPQASLVIADQDGSFASQFLRGAFGQGPLAELVVVSEADSAHAVSLAADGKVSAALFIPRGFGSDYLAGKTPTLTLLKNPSETILPGIVEEAIAVLADGGFYLRELFGRPIRTIRGLSDTAEARTDSVSSEITSEIQLPFQKASPYLFPPVVRVGTLQEASGAAKTRTFGFLTLFFPGILTMSMLFVGQALAVDVWSEHKLGTFRRLEVSPRGTRGLVLAKVLTSTFVLWMIFEILLVVGRYLFRVELERIHLAALYAAVCGFGVLAALHLVMVLARSENGGTVLCSLIVMPLVFLGGSFFPFETLSPTMRSVGLATPNGQILVQIKRIAFGDPLTPAVWITALACVVVGSIVVWLASLQARRRFLGAS
ncbi:MAG: ABC transporter permease [Candidatus Eisenbacteria bacterium]